MRIRVWISVSWTKSNKIEEGKVGEMVVGEMGEKSAFADRDEETFKRFRRTIGSFHEWADERLDPDLLAIATELLTAAGSAGCFRTLDRQLGLYLLHAHPICRVSFSLREEARVSHAGCQLGECPVPVPRSMLHNCRNTWFFSTLAIVEARRQIVAVPAKLQNNTNPCI